MNCARRRKARYVDGHIRIERQRSLEPELLVSKAGPVDEAEIQRLASCEDSMAADRRSDDRRTGYRNAPAILETEMRGEAEPIGAVSRTVTWPAPSTLWWNQGEGGGLADRSLLKTVSVPEIVKGACRLIGVAGRLGTRTVPATISKSPSYHTGTNNCWLQSA